MSKNLPPQSTITLSQKKLGGGKTWNGPFERASYLYMATFFLMYPKWPKGAPILENTVFCHATCPLSKFGDLG